ncbi:MAG TPA: hypothetical protein VHW00_23995 [Thermoanaerobaculia bacterium]|nr:hypothetical protein [Thermoanaerobaculia bacterium]
MITLLLLPGLDGTGTLFGEFIAALPPHIAPVVIRYPTDEALSYEELLAFIEERLPEGTFAVLGESFSGPLAIELAAKSPRVRAVILCASFVRSPVRFAAWLVRPSLRVTPRWRLPGCSSERFARRPCGARSRWCSRACSPLAFAACFVSMRANH